MDPSLLDRAGFVLNRADLGPQLAEVRHLLEVRKQGGPQESDDEGSQDREQVQAVPEGLCIALVVFVLRGLGEIDPVLGAHDGFDPHRVVLQARGRIPRDDLDVGARPLRLHGRVDREIPQEQMHGLLVDDQIHILRVETHEDGIRVRLRVVRPGDHDERLDLHGDPVEGLIPIIPGPDRKIGSRKRRSRRVRASGSSWGGGNRDRDDQDPDQGYFGNSFHRQFSFFVVLRRSIRVLRSSSRPMIPSRTTETRTTDPSTSRNVIHELSTVRRLLCRISWPFESRTRTVIFASPRYSERIHGEPSVISCRASSTDTPYPRKDPSTYHWLCRILTPTTGGRITTQWIEPDAWVQLRSNPGKLRGGSSPPPEGGLVSTVTLSIVGVPDPSLARMICTLQSWRRPSVYGTWTTTEDPLVMSVS